MPCEDGQHERMLREEEQGEYKYVDKVMWKSEDKTKLIRISLCKKCKLVYWDDVVEERTVTYIKPDPDDPDKSWQFGKPLRGKAYKEAVKKWNAKKALNS